MGNKKVRLIVYLCCCITTGIIATDSAEVTNVGQVTNMVTSEPSNHDNSLNDYQIEHRKYGEESGYSARQEQLDQGASSPSKNFPNGSAIADQVPRSQETQLQDTDRDLHTSVKNKL